jgi:hypothetical protein
MQLGPYIQATFRRHGNDGLAVFDITAAAGK